MVPGLDNCFIIKLVLVPVLNNYCIFKLVLIPVLNSFSIIKLVLVPVSKFLHYRTGTDTSYLYCLQFKVLMGLGMIMCLPI